MKNYSRFFGLLAKLPVHNSGMKEEFVAQYTGGRTSSLRDMTREEYDTMCDALDGSLQQKSVLRASRSAALHIMQRLGIDTTDWTRINAFCADKRIAGKQFYHLTATELDALTVKLRSIQRNGGLKPHVEQQRPVHSAPVQQVLYMPLQDNGILN